MFYVYKIVNKTDGKTYVGKTKNFSKRKNDHLHKSTNIHLRNAIKKYGKESFEFSIISEHSSESECFEQEKFWILEFKKSNIELYNLTEGGEGSSGFEPSKETRLKISLSLIGNKRSLGVKHTEETKVNLSKIRTGKIRSEQARKNISDGRLGIKFSEIHKANLSISHTGHKHSDEHKNNIGKFSRGRTWKLIDGKRVWMDK